MKTTLELAFANAKPTNRALTIKVIGAFDRKQARDAKKWKYRERAKKPVSVRASEDGGGVHDSASPPPRVGAG